MSNLTEKSSNQTRVFAVVGAENARKSSVLRALTGAAQKAIYDVAVLGGVIKCFVSITALQEPKTMSATNFIRFVRTKKIENIAIPLRLFGEGDLPGAESYLQQFGEAGWVLAPLIVLGATDDLVAQAGLTRYGPRILANSRIVPTNQTAAKIRKIWDWV